MSNETHNTPGMFYSIGQVAKHADLPQSVLRYWETVFDRLKPKKSDGGSRQYSEADVQIILTIKELLYAQGFTIKGANNQLNDYIRHSGVSAELTDLAPGFELGKNNSTLPKLAGEDYVYVINELIKILEIMED